MAGKTLFGCQMIVSVSSTNNEYSNSILKILFTSSEWQRSVTLIFLQAVCGRISGIKKWLHYWEKNGNFPTWWSRSGRLTALCRCTCKKRSWSWNLLIICPLTLERSISPNVDFFKNKSSFFFISSFFVISCSLAIFSSFLFFLKKLINSAGIYASVETSLWTTRPVFQKIRCALRFMRLAKRRSSSYQDACGRLVIHRDYLGARSFWILSEPVLYWLTNFVKSTATDHICLSQMQFLLQWRLKHQQSKAHLICTWRIF